MIGKSVAHYRVLEELGRGGMGVVYRARDTRLGRMVALKFLPDELSRDPQALARFEREARTASSLNHPNICTIYEIGRHEDHWYIAMEVLEGRTLQQVISGGPIASGLLEDLALQIADALDAAHSRGIVHRDIKPANIFVNARGQAKVLDFGLAKRSPSATPGGSEAPTEFVTYENLSESGAVMGTVAYMSPEQARGNALDARSDLFSLGAVLYEMTTGRPAFSGATLAVIFHQILSGEPPWPADLRPPEGIPAIIKKLLEKDLALRYQTAAEVCADLKRLKRDTLSAPVESLRARSGSPLFPLRGAALLTALAAIAGLLVVWTLGSWGDGTRPALSATIKSLAVLPLDNLSGDSDQEYLADGMTEALVTDLAQIESLRVISRGSVMGYKGSRKPLPELARELNVDAVIEGSVQRSGNRVRITAQLIHAATDQHLWARSYERDFQDVLTLQSEVASAIAGEVQAKLTPEEKTRLSRVRHVNGEAHEAYLKGRHALAKATEKEIRAAIQHFQDAVRADQDSALAWAGLAESYQLLAYLYYETPKQALPKARTAALNALKLDETLAEPHVVLGYVQLFFDWDWKGAETELKIAMDLNPNSADAYRWYGLYLVTLGRTGEAVDAARRSQQLDPLDPTRNTDVQWLHLLARNYAQAAIGCRNVLSRNPGFAYTHATLAMALTEMGQFADAIKESKAATELDGSPLFLAILASSYGKAGRVAEAEATLRELEVSARRRYVCAYEAAIGYLSLGRKNEAFQWFEKAYQDRADCMVYLRIDPRLDSIRPDTRFQELIRKVGVPTD